MRVDYYNIWLPGSAKVDSTPKDYKIGICCPPPITQKELGIRIICQSGVTSLPAKCCFSDLALSKSNQTCCQLVCYKADAIIIIIITIHLSICCLFSKWHSCKITYLAFNNNCSLAVSGYLIDYSDKLTVFELHLWQE